MSYFPERVNTDRLLEMLAEGLLDKDNFILACLNWMTDRDVGEMAEANEFFPQDDEDDEDDE